MKAIVLLVLIAGIVAVLPCIAVAQAKSDESVTLVTVCEVLKDPQHFNGRIWPFLVASATPMKDCGCLKMIVDSSSQPEVMIGRIWFGSTAATNPHQIRRQVHSCWIRTFWPKKSLRSEKQQN